MQIKNNENNVCTNDIMTIPYIVYESEQSRSERNIKRLISAIIILIAIVFASNLVWLYAWCQYDYVSEETSVTVDGGGDGNANYVGNNTNYVGNDGDINNGENNGKDAVENENEQNRQGN